MSITRTKIATMLDLRDGVPEDDFLSRIRQHGWTGTYVGPEADNPYGDFYYTTGLWLSIGFPEIIAFSMTREIAECVARKVYEIAGAGTPPKIGKPSFQILGEQASVFKAVPRGLARNWLVQSDWFYLGQSFRAVEFEVLPVSSPESCETDAGGTK